MQQCLYELDHLRHFVASMRMNGDTVCKMAEFNENMRRRCQHELNLKMSQIDA